MIKNTNQKVDRERYEYNFDIIFRNKDNYYGKSIIEIIEKQKSEDIKNERMLQLVTMISPEKLFKH